MCTYTKFEMNLINSSYLFEIPKGRYYAIKQWQCSPKAQSVNKVKWKGIDNCAFIIDCCLEATITLNHKASFFAEAKHLPLLKHIRSNIFAEANHLPLKKTH